MARKLEWHDTPNHGSWLHMAEIDLRVLQQQCRDRRSPDADTLKRAIAAWEHQRNAEQATIDGRFSVTDARKKLERLSPSLPALWSTSQQSHCSVTRVTLAHRPEVYRCRVDLRSSHPDGSWKITGELQSHRLSVGILHEFRLLCKAVVWPG